ncbi:MBL fold metallo-hydrolase [bacterium]|nr:MBL fold metallo-hydrolase [bacterium]
MRVTVLASGSSGNAFLVSTDTTSLLMDAGISARRVAQAVTDAGVDPADLAGVFVTHEHSDHISGIGPIARRFALPVYATAGTLSVVRRRAGDGFDEIPIAPGDPLTVGDITVSPFSLSHDCADPVGFTFMSDSARLVVATDLGVVSSTVRDQIARADCVVLEFNHDERMLIDGSYTWPLKQRIMSNVGHLSNSTAARELSHVADYPVSTVILAHLSKENNSPRLAYEAATAALDAAGRSDVAVLLASQEEPLGPVEFSTSKCRA